MRRQALLRPEKIRAAAIIHRKKRISGAARARIVAAAWEIQRRRAARQRYRPRGRPAPGIFPNLCSRRPARIYRANSAPRFIAHYSRPRRPARLFRRRAATLFPGPGLSQRRFIRLRSTCYGRQIADGPRLKTRRASWTPDRWGLPTARVRVWRSRIKAGRCRGFVDLRKMWSLGSDYCRNSSCRASECLTAAVYCEIIKRIKYGRLNFRRSLIRKCW